MTKNPNPMSLIAIALVAGAAMGVPALAQNDRPRPAAQGQDVRGGTDFRTSDWIVDRTVVNDKGEEIAEVSDVVIERGSGRAEHLIVKTGAVLGLGGKAVAIPFGAFRWDSKGEKLVLASTADQLKQYPVFTAEEWSAMMESKDTSRSALHDRMGSAGASGDPYASSIGLAKKSRVEGEIKSVDRLRMPQFSEQVVVTVAAQDGSTKKVVLGPSWFVNGAKLSPSRGERLAADTLELPRDPDGVAIATTVRIGDRELRVRADDGKPVWSGRALESGGKSYGAPYWRYLLGSSLDGMKVDCRGESCGKVDDVIVERQSGQVAFLSIDPDQNVLGISDTKRLVPWSVVTVALDGTARIDASREMIIASPETPSDVSTLGSGDRASMVYRAYQVPAPRFDPAKETALAPNTVDDGWAVRSEAIALIDRSSAKSISGTIVSIDQVTFERGVGPARAVRIRTAGEEQLVLLGPAWYGEKQAIPCEAGAPITVDACRTLVAGQPHWIARSLDCKGTHVVLIDAAGTPAWTTK